MAFMRAKAEGERDRARTALVAIQELHGAKHGERPVYASDDYHAEREPVRWHKYTICTNCHTEFPCSTRKLADEGLAGEERG